MKRLRVMLIAGGLLAVGGCVQQPAVQPEFDPQAPLSFDGLVPIRHASLAQAWADPDVDFSQYTRFIAGGASFEYRDVIGSGAGTTTSRSSRSSFPIDQGARERFEAIVLEIFDEELANSERFTETTEPGANTIVVEGGLLDVASMVPPRAGSRGDVWVDRIGEATLVIEIRDSLTNSVIARGVERRALRPRGNDLVRANSASSTQEVRRVARDWAVILREALDDFGNEI